jgi:hypothetical protein
MASEFNTDDIGWDEIFYARDTEDASEVIPADSDIVLPALVPAITTESSPSKIASVTSSYHP